MLRTVVAIAFSISTFVLAAHAGVNEFESCRCGNTITSKGDKKQEVLEKCGKPVQKMSSPNRDCPEMWLYNFGPNEFMQGICFDHKAQVKKVLSLNRGY